MKTLHPRDEPVGVEYSDNYFPEEKIRYGVALRDAIEQRYCQVGV